MAGSLSPIARPQAGERVDNLWRIVDALVVFANSVLGAKFVTDSGNAGVTFTEGGTIFEVGAGGGGGLGPLIFVGMKAGELQYYSVNAEEIDPPEDGVADSSP